MGLHASVRSSVRGWDGYRAVTADSFCRYGSRKSVTLLTLLLTRLPPGWFLNR